MEAERALTITMTISFTPNTNIKEVEVAGYGVVKIRPYGAGEELQIAKNIRELNELQQQAEKMLDVIKADYNEDDTKIPEELKKDFASIQNKVTNLSNELNDLIKGTISSDDPAVAERIFNELPLTEVRRLVATALGKGADAEAN